MTLKSLRAWWPVAAAVLLIGLIAVAAENSSIGLRPAPPLVQIDLPTNPPPTLENHPPPAGGGGELPEIEDSGFALPPWLITAMIVLAVLVVAGVVGAAVVVAVRDQLRKRDAGRVAPRRRGAVAEEMVAALDAGLQELATDGDPRGAVITCWVRLEQAAADAGTPRRPGDTPAELVTRLLREHRVDRGVLAGFAEVYREARYATHAVDERMRAEAVAALHRVRDDLTATAAGGAA
ncbi:hypothetical protein J2S43_007824 [Catenuloplanes nepalensis]|uniref:Protein-glutamine gamma-glutamyltransferase-like C-terminal domain-containing protein n=1 Tax=Catenuloplanes nepalensis TaxID=587533 RepID=A0ABT9N6I6_9ACTN|nr:DUF4129 domain-containing protein [Catenuloplanes nepalensis]MDP9799312.1 hypothetical protein [Catenuloplanes nepalensis]